jgi:hypothetical protein
MSSKLLLAALLALALALVVLLEHAQPALAKPQPCSEVCGAVGCIGPSTCWCEQLQQIVERCPKCPCAA